ncbi:MAG: hypothetical protein ACM3PW_18850 [Chlamydiota bacterium]
MAAPAQQPIPEAQSAKLQDIPERREPTMEDMLRECIELCARVAERHAAPEVAQQIRRLKPASRWP